MGAPRIDMVGQKYGMLSVLSCLESRGSTKKERFYLCRCDCGKTKEIMGKNVRNGRTKSCGCVRDVESHGLAKSPTYLSWVAMRQRCTNPNATGFERYGGAGITICKRWDSFTAFFKDMGERPVGMSLDRKNNARGYSKANCQWATAKQQANNRKKRMKSCV